jgi:hypothetical protein
MAAGGGIDRRRRAGSCANPRQGFPFGRIEAAMDAAARMRGLRYDAVVAPPNRRVTRASLSGATRTFIWMRPSSEVLRPITSVFS